MKIVSEKKLVDKFADILQQIYQLIIFYTYIEESDGDEMIHNDTLNDYGTVYSSCAIYTVILVISIISISISSGFVYFHWYLKKGNTETAIY